MLTWLSRLGARNDAAAARSSGRPKARDCTAPRGPGRSGSRAGPGRPGSGRRTSRRSPERVPARGPPRPRASSLRRLEGRAVQRERAAVPTARSARSPRAWRRAVLSNAARPERRRARGAPIQGARRTAGCCSESAGWPKPQAKPGRRGVRLGGESLGQPAAGSPGRPGNRVTLCESMREGLGISQLSLAYCAPAQHATSCASWRPPSSSR